MGYWRPEGEENPTGAAIPRRRRAVTPAPAEEVFINAPEHKRAQTSTAIPPRRRYARPVIGTLNIEATTRYYAARAAAARALGHRLEGGVLGPGAFNASCACGAKLSPGELSAVTTPCPGRP